MPPEDRVLSAQATGIRPLLMALVLSLAAGLCLVTSFVSAFHSPTPHNVPVAVVGSRSAVTGLEQALAAHMPGALEVHQYTSETAAEEAILDRTVSGAFLPGKQSATLLVAGVSGDAINSVLTGAFQAATGAQGVRLTVQDIRPLPAHDSRGLSGFFLILATLISSFLFAVLLFFLAPESPLPARIATMVIFAAVNGLLIALVADTMLGALTGHFWSLAGLAALFSLTITAATGGLQRLFGPPGSGLAALLLLVLGVPATGGPVGAVFLPDFFRGLASALPAGAVAPALRNVIYFDGHAISGPILMLIAWALAGLALIVLVDRVHARQRAPLGIL